MDSKDYRELLVRERASGEMSDEEFENTLIHFAKLYCKEVLDKID